MWKFYAILSALFAAATAILAKVGLKGVNGNMATAIRTIVILFIAWGIVLATGEISQLKTLSKNNLIFLGLSGLATGLSWIFYFKALETGNVSKVAPIDKLSVAIAMGLAFLILKEPIETKTLIGGGLIVAGSLVILL
ncbi:EamA family transporter [Pedobacter sp. ISL-68]|uniref:EamA family transporter n=1 Tax=unclassified Pedobacter TaxID=2628915 RepID=UPI001BEC6523|nr:MULTISPECIES: EamA family transporter [unclassified Pedobacter]MBT2562107.1 EamA family transporter [Pedobacter sp. ISL-64]MBT2591694.1 EamA family transporter [Pedobacter sp. ISL-68]